MLKEIDRRLFGGAVGDWFYQRRIDRRLGELSSALDYRYVVHYDKNRRDLLSELCDKYGSDKGEIRTTDHPYSWPSHTYADFYSRLFSHCRNKVQRVFECGLGTNDPEMLSSMGVNGQPGASLRVWRDYFPQAEIFGADIDRKILFEEERIRTFYIDQLDPRAIEQFWESAGVGNFDFMIDDGLHTFDAGSCLFRHSISHLAEDGIYVIEDVKLKDFPLYQDFFNRGEFEEFVVDYVTLFRPNIRLSKNNMIVIRRA